MANRSDWWACICDSIRLINRSSAVVEMRAAQGIAVSTICSVESGSVNSMFIVEIDTQRPVTVIGAK